jgi:TonB family protein
MNKLGMIPDLEEQSENIKSGFLQTEKKDNREIPLNRAIVYSTIAHPAVLAFLWLLIKLFLLLLAILGITLPLFEKPKPKIRDIEFVLVNKPEQTPIDKNTRNRADRNTRAGGKHDPTQKVSEPEPVTAKSEPQKQAAAPAPKPQKTQQQKQPQQKTPAPPRPTPKKNIPKPVITPPRFFPIPVPKSHAPKSLSPAGGPVTSAPTGANSPNMSPSPMMAGPRGSSSGQNRYSSPYSNGGGSAGNPGAGNPSGSPGIDAIKEPDFGTYMRELQRRIKRNWDPPRGNDSKRVVLIFKVSRDGRLLSLRVLNSSGIQTVDRAAISAVELTAPFKPLPPEYKGNDIDIQFTFDYNVFGVGKY